MLHGEGLLFAAADGGLERSQLGRVTTEGSLPFGEAAELQSGCRITEKGCTDYQVLADKCPYGLSALGSLPKALLSSEGV